MPCSVAVCGKTFRSTRRLVSHIQKKHKNFYNEHHGRRQVLQQNVAQGEPGELHEEGNFSEEEPNYGNPNVEARNSHDTDGNELIVAKSLLNIKTQYNVQYAVMGTVAEEIQKCVELGQKEMINRVVTILNNQNIQLNEAQMDELGKNLGVVDACINLNAKHKIENFVSRHMKYVAPQEIILGHDEQNKIETMQYVPLVKLLQNLLQFQDVFEAVMNDHRSGDGILRDVVDGHYMQENELFSQQNTLGLILYSDEFTVSNPLRGRSKKYKVMATYVALANIPPHLRLQAHAIQLVSLCQSVHLKKYGFANCFTEFTRELKALEENGLSVTVEGQEHHFPCRSLVFVGDNLASHQMAGFMTSFSAGRPCRFCTCSLGDLREGRVGEPRNSEDHSAQLGMVEQQPELAAVYGVKGRAVFSELESLNAVSSYPSDIAHDILHGVGNKTLSLVIKSCIDNGYCSMNYLNACIKEFPYSGRDKVDKPGPITINEGRVEVKQTFAQLRCLLRLLPLMLAGVVPENDEPWGVLIKLLRVMEYIFAPCLREGHIRVMKDLITDFHDSRRLVFPEVNTTPKEHFILPVTHCKRLANGVSAGG